MKRIRYLILFFMCLFNLGAVEKQEVILKVSGGLENNDNYELSGVILTNPVKGINGDELDLILNHNYIEGHNFIDLGDTYSYPYNTGEEYIIFSTEYNSSTKLIEGNFQLSNDGVTAEGDPYKEILIDDDFQLPASDISLTEEIVGIGNLFSYSEGAETIDSHFTAYKNQEFMLRISYGGTDTYFDPYNKLNSIKLAMNNEEDFLNKSINYIDFIFNGDDYGKLSNVKTDYGITINFVPGSIYVSGLSNGNYNLKLYSFRYSNELADRGYVISTLEDELNFTADDINTSESIYLLNYYEGNHPEINLQTMIISNTISPTITMAESYRSTSMDITPTVTFEQYEGEYYVDSTTTIVTTTGGLILSPDIDSNPATDHYLIKATMKYTSPFVSKDSIRRYVKIAHESSNISFDYAVKWNTLPPITDYAYQTLIGFFNPVKEFGTDDYELKDKGMSKYTYGYRDIKYVSGIGIEEIVRGNYENILELAFDDDSYLWTGSSGSQNSIMISKAVSDSKGEFFRTATDIQSYLTFYTLKNIQNFTYEEEAETEKDDKATFLWQDSPSSSFGEIITDAVLVFRISRINDMDTALKPVTYTVDGENYSVELPEYYLDLYNNTYPIGNTDENTAIEQFVNEERDYLDILFEKGEDREVEAANALFNFSKENALRITGLPRGTYMIQMYSLKDSDILTQKNNEVSYMTFTYEGYKTFEIGLPTLVTGDFASKNNLFMIDGINVYSNYDVETGNPVKNIQINFVTKVQESVLVQMENLIAENKEEIDGGDHSMPEYSIAEWHELDYLEPVEGATLSKSGKGDFQFPLDIIFLVDDSGSMQNEIDSTKEGLTNFTQNLEERGFDVKFNLITFGPDQNSRTWSWFGGWGQYPVGDWVDKIYQYHDSGYLAIYKPVWFDDVYELVDAFDELYATGGYYRGQENGGAAIKWGADYLKANGRYLDYSNEIVNHNEYREGYIPSKKWLIILTDENMDDDELDVLPGVRNYNDFINQTTSIIREESISLTGIYHINRRERDDLGQRGYNPADTGDRSYNIFEGYLGDLFTRYEMGGDGENVSTNLSNSVNTVGIIQRWVLKYESPFNESDGYRRQAIFSLEGFEDINGNILEIKPFIRDEDGDRYYRVPEEKVQAYFTKPDPEERILYEENGKVVVQVHAKSQYNKILDDGSTQIVNYRIEKGYFKLYNDEGSLGLSSELGDITITSILNGWYEITAEIDRDLYYSNLGEGIVNIEATVTTKENGKTIRISSVEVIEIDPPLIISVSLTNDTLYNLLVELKDENGVRLYTDEEAFQLSNVSIENESGITVDEITSYFNASKLNVKLGDTISYIVEAEDYNITNLNSSNVIIAGNTASMIEPPSSLFDNVWIYSGTTVVDSENSYISILIVDDIGNKSELLDVSGVPVNIDALHYPVSIEKTTFENLVEEEDEPTYFNSELTASPQDDKAKVTALYQGTEVLAYLVRFDYTSEFSDGYVYDDILEPVNTYNILIDNSYWAASADADFLFSDGKYTFRDILVLNKAGGIMGYTENTIEDILTKASEELLLDNRELYVDTVAPRIKNIFTEKIYDSSGMEIIGSDYEVKNLDRVEFNIEMDEVNYSESILNTNTTKVFQLSSAFDELRTIAQERYEIIYNVIDRKENLDMEFEIFDKAGNSTIENYTMTYNTKTPKDLEIEGLVIEPMTGYKFTNLLDYPLKEMGTGEEIAYAKVNVVSDDFRAIASLPVNISYFDTQPVLENMNNNLLLTTYTEAGIASITRNDQIVVDTDINGGSIPETEATSANGSDYSLDLNLNNIEELVGLYGFRVVTPDVTVTGGSQDGNGYYILNGGNYSVSKSTSTYIESYKLHFVYLGQANIALTVELKDRLENTKEFTIPVKIKYIIQLKGKTDDSTKEINSTIEMGEDNIEIKGVISK